MTRLWLLVAVALSQFIPAPDLDAPHVYRKACIYCLNCTPNHCIDSLVIDDWYLDILSDEELAKLRSCYICQRTGKRMAFDSVGIVEWGSFVIADTTWNEFYIDRREGDVWLYYEPGSFVLGIDTTIIADTSGIKRLE